MMDFNCLNSIEKKDAFFFSKNAWLLEMNFNCLNSLDNNDTSRKNAWFAGDELQLFEFTR